MLLFNFGGDGKQILAQWASSSLWWKSAGWGPRLCKGLVSGRVLTCSWENHLFMRCGVFFYFIFSGKSIFLLKHTLELVMASSAQSPTVPLPLAKHWQKNWDKRYRSWEKICIYADLGEQEMGFGCSFKCQFFCTHPTPILGWFCSFFGLPITIFNQFSPHSFPLTGEPGSHLPPWWRGQEVQEQTGRPAQTCHQHHALMALPASHGEHHSHQNTLKNGK